MTRFMPAARKPSLACLLVLTALAVACPIQSQSLLSAGGLGFPMEPLDARARGVGGVALGMPGLNLSVENPAELAGVPAPTLQIGVQPDFRSAVFGDTRESGSTVRFPSVQAVFPVGQRWAASVGYVAFLDQNWAAEDSATVMLGGESVAVRDRFVSEGGVSALRVAGAYAPLERLAVGGRVDVYTGSVERRLSRVFDEGGVLPAQSAGRWRYGGVGFGAGTAWTPIEAIRISGAASVGGTLRADPAGDGQEQPAEYQLPLRLSAGVSGRVTPNTVLVASSRWSGWSEAGDELSSRDAWQVAGGLEWESATTGNRTYPVRLGGRYATLPFRWVGANEDAEFPTERALTAGIGAHLAAGAARADLGVERGLRGGNGAGIEESFWRIVVSLTVLGQ